MVVAAMVAVAATVEVVVDMEEVAAVRVVTAVVAVVMVAAEVVTAVAATVATETVDLATPGAAAVLPKAAGGIRFRVMSVGCLFLWFCPGFSVMLSFADAWFSLFDRWV